jgi:hypothetical protein
MKSPFFQSTFHSRKVDTIVTLLCMALLLPRELLAIVEVYAEPPPAEDQAPAIPADQLDSLVAPIALYPDPLLSQTLVASTYPLEIIQLQQWLAQNKHLKDKALADAVMKQDWDPSIQAMAAFPDVVKRLADNIKWTTDLGNAFLAQQSDVMDAVQRMRAKANAAGNLKSTEQQVVETKAVEGKTVYVIQPASTQVVYVPTYNPVVVYGPPVYPYPPIYYPPPGYYATGMAVSFGIGVAMGAAWGGSGGWGYGCGWGSHNDVTINNNNTYVRHSNVNRPANGPAGGAGNNWQHNPQHRGGAPYSSRATAHKYGGTARGDSMQSRRAAARLNASNVGGGRPQPGTMDRGAGGRPQAGAMDRGAGGSGFGGGGEKIGNRNVPNTPSARNNSAFGGAGSGMDRGAARASSQRGASSMGGARGGGGYSRGGRGGSRSGGGRRR